LRGLHLTGDLYGCACEQGLLSDREALRARCIDLCRSAGFEVVGDAFHQFTSGGGGVTGTVLLAESHLAIHTWPESGSVTLDVYICDYSQQNSDKAEALYQRALVAFAPGEKLTHRLQRGKP
jgi:S-adenosylmethionine decarboxylase proenzyme